MPKDRMEIVEKKKKQHSLAGKLDAFSQMSKGDPMPNSQGNSVKAKELLANMPDSEFKKLAQEILATGDKDKINALFSNFPFKGQ